MATRPQVVVLVNEHDWPAALAASSLAGAPLGAPILYSEGDTLPAVSREDPRSDATRSGPPRSAARR